MVRAMSTDGAQYVKSSEEQQADIDLANHLREIAQVEIVLYHNADNKAEALIRAALVAVGELTEEHPLGISDDAVIRVWDAYLIARQAPHS